MEIIGHNIREKKIKINRIAQIQTSIYRIHKLRKVYLLNSNMVFERQMRYHMTIVSQNIKHNPRRNFEWLVYH